MSSETNFWSPRLIFVNRDSSLVSMECSFVSEPATWYPDARSHFRLHGHKLRDRGQQNTGLSSSPRCRIYGAEFGTFGALSGSSLQTYQTPHRRFYEDTQNAKSKHIKYDDDEKSTLCLIVTFHSTLFLPILFDRRSLNPTNTSFCVPRCLTTGRLQKHLFKNIWLGERFN